MSQANSVCTGIIGSGRVARAMGRLLREWGAEIVVAGREPGRTAEAARFIGGSGVASIDEIGGQVGRMLIAVSDSAVAGVASRLARNAAAGTIALHTCGVHGAGVLEPLTKVGVHCGALHPLATVPSGEAGLRTLAGARFGFTGGEQAREWASEIVTAVGGEMNDVPEAGRALYHAAAALACNSIPGLLDTAAAMLAGSGAVDRSEALPLLERLVRSSLENSLTFGPEAALTGPIRRGDTATVLLHLKSLSGQDPAIGHLYRTLGLRQAELARRAGLDEEKVKRLLEVLHNG